MGKIVTETILSIACVSTNFDSDYEQLHTTKPLL